MSRVSKDAISEPNLNALPNRGLSDRITMDANTSVMTHKTFEGDHTVLEKSQEIQEGAITKVYEVKDCKISGSKVGHGNIKDICSSGKSMKSSDALDFSYTPESIFQKLLESGIADKDLKKLLQKKMLVKNLAFVLSNPQYNQAIIKHLTDD